MKIIWHKGTYGGEGSTMLKHPHLLFKGGTVINLTVVLFLLLSLPLIFIIIKYPNPDKSTIMSPVALGYIRFTVYVWLGMIITGMVNKARFKSTINKKEKEEII